MIAHRRRYQSPAAPICPHCGKELPDEDTGTLWPFFAAIACCLLGVACMVVGLATVANWVMGYQDTLWHSIQNTAKTVGSLARRLW